MAQMGKSGSANELEGTSLAPLYPDTSWLAGTQRWCPLVDITCSIYSLLSTLWVWLPAHISISLTRVPWILPSLLHYLVSPEALATSPGCHTE